MNIKSLPQRIFELSLGALAVALILTWAWSLLRPLVPVVVSIGGVLVLLGLLAQFVVRRRGSW